MIIDREEIVDGDAASAYTISTRVWRPERHSVHIGLVSDTHDLLRPEVVEELAGADRILHMGDVCNPEILASLREIAPLDAVRGNCDHGEWAGALPVSDTWEIGGILVHARHDLSALDLDPGAAGIQLVLSGHTHQPHYEEIRGVLFVNPGSAGPRRFTLPISVGHLEIQNQDDWSVRLVTLG